MANKKVEGMRYLFVENGVYYFRKVVPEKLQQAYGKKLIKRSLLTHIQTCFYLHYLQIATIQPVHCYSELA